MSALNDGLDKLRGDAQALYKQLMDATGKNPSAIRTNLQAVATDAQQLSKSIRSLIETLQADAQPYMRDAVAQVDEAAKEAKSAAAGQEADLKSAGMALLARARIVAQDLSQAVAAQRHDARFGK